MTNLTVNSKDIDVSQSRAPIFIKFGILCTNTRHIPKWFAYFCYIFAHLETIAMIFKSADICIQVGGDTLSSISQTFYKILIMSEWATYDDSLSVNLLLNAVLIYLLILLGLGSYLIFKLKWNCPIPHSVQVSWSTICYVHNLLILFPIQAFLFKVLKYYYRGIFTPQDNTYTLVLLILDIFINLSLSTANSKFFQVMIKTKDPLSTKNHFVQSYDIASKMTVTFFWLFIGDDAEWLKTMLLFATLFDCLLRDAALYYLLPYYHIQTLEIGCILQGTTTALAALSVFFEILDLSGVKMSGYQLEITWLLLSPLAMILFYSLMWRLLVRVLMKDLNELNIYEAVQKRAIFRYLMKKRLEPHHEQSKIDIRYFILRSRVNSLLRHWKITFAEFNENKTGVQKVVKKLLLNIIKKHPKSELAKVSLAYFYVKYENSFLLANNLIEEVLTHAPTFRARISMSLVRMELQKKLFIQYTHQEVGEEKCDGLNMLKFVQVHDTDDELKQHIDEQIKLQMNFWNNFLAHEPEMGTLAEISTKVSERRRKVAKAWQKLLAVRDPKFSRPLLMYGLYSSFVNNEALLGEKCIEQYQKDVKKYSGVTEKDEMTDNTLFSDRTIQVSMSGLRTKLGRITDCSASIDTLFGWRKDLIVDRNVNMIMPPFFQERHDAFLLDHYNTGRTKLLNRTVPIAVLARDGYVIPAWMHIKINPHVDAGLSYIATLRPTNVAKTMLLIRKDGSIDGMAREFAQDMNILHRKSNSILKIFDFCPNFKVVNDAFNIMALRTMINNSGAAASPVSAKTRVLDGIQTPKDAITPRSKNHKTSLDYTPHHLGRSLMQQMTQMTQVLDVDYEAQSVFDQFSVGSTLYFYPQRNYAVSQNNIALFKESQNELEPILYNVKVTNKIFDKEFIKILSIEKVYDENDQPLRKYDSGKSTSKKTSKGSELLPSFEIDADEKSPGTKDLVKKLSDQRPRQTYPSLLTPISTNRQNNWGKDENTGVNMDESCDLSVLDEIQAYGSGGPKGLEINKEESSPYNTRTGPNTGRDDLTPRIVGTVLITGREDLTPRIPLLRALDDEPRTDRFLKTDMDTHAHTPQLKKLVVNTCNNQKNKLKKVVEEAMHGQESSGNGNGTSMRAHHKDPHLEDNLLRRKIKRLTEKMNRGIADQPKAENSIASTYLSKGRKVQTMVNQALKMGNNKRSALFFIYFCIVFLIVSVIIEIIQLITVYESIIDIRYKCSIIAKGLLRIDSLATFEQGTLYYKWWMNGYINLTEFKLTKQEMIGMGTGALLELNSYNSYLRQEVSNIGDEFQKMFYQNDVRIYERQDNNAKVLLSRDSNFDAIQTLVQKGLKVFNTQTPDVEKNLVPLNTEDAQYILDNSLNDLLISAENSVSILGRDLTSRLNSTTTSISVVFGIYLALVVVFMIICVNYLFIMRKSAKRFMNLFFRLEPKEAEKTKAFLKYFMESLDSDMLDIDIPEEAPDQLDEGKSAAKSTKNYRQASLSKQYRHQILLFMKMIPFFALLIGGCVGYIVLLSGIIDQIDRKQVQIQSALETQNEQNLLITEMVEMIAENSTTTSKNRNITLEFLDKLDQVQKVAELINKFRTPDQTLEASHQEIFYGFPCIRFQALGGYYGTAAYQFCLNVAGERSVVGLAQVTSQIYVMSSQFYELYLATPKVQENLIHLLYQGTQTLRPLVTVAQGMLRLLYEATYVIFTDKANQLQEESIIVTVAIIFCILLSSIWVWHRMVKKIIAYEAKDREILQIVPIKLILANRYIRQHLLQDAGAMLDGIKRFL